MHLPRTQTDNNLRLWLEHVVAENKRDLDRLVETLSEEAVYTVVPLKKEWRGKAEIREFYTMLWTALPDVKLDLMSRVADEHYVVEELTRARHAHRSFVRDTAQWQLYRVRPGDLLPVQGWEDHGRKALSGCE